MKESVHRIIGTSVDLPRTTVCEPKWTDGPMDGWTDRFQSKP
jgi:hypothetical protein